MNILFLDKALNYGGVSIVTMNLANRFVADNHKICIFAFARNGHSAANRLKKEVNFITGCGWAFSLSNIKLLRRIIKDYNINFVINQWGLPFKAILTARLAGWGANLKYWSFYHNDPSANGRIQSVAYQINDCKNFLKRGMLRIKYWIAKFLTSRSMKLSYRLSDKYCLLSNKFVSVFSVFTGISHPKKIEVLTNPITIDGDDFYYNDTKKQSEIMYCGRLEYNPKRVDRIIDAWNKLESKYPKWNLTIVGDGSHRLELEAHAKKLALAHVSFTGFQSPIPFYKRASILLLTSDFEGFPLVLAEAMQFGVVPIVYGSYVAVHDIIDDGINGFITPTPYSVDDTVDRLRLLMDNENLRKQMATAAVEKASLFSMDKIASKWYSLMNDIKEK